MYTKYLDRKYFHPKIYCFHFILQVHLNKYETIQICITMLQQSSKPTQRVCSFSSSCFGSVIMCSETINFPYKSVHNKHLSVFLAYTITPVCVRNIYTSGSTTHILTACDALRLCASIEPLREKLTLQPFAYNPYHPEMSTMFAGKGRHKYYTHTHTHTQMPYKL